MKLIFATNNNNKIEEAYRIIGNRFKIISMNDAGITGDIEENHETLEGNALEKARFVYNKTGLNCFAEDTGLEVHALNNEPGVKSARYAGKQKDSEANIRKLLEKLKGLSGRSARFRCVAALIFNNKEYLFEGIVNGEILHCKSGSSGFGYDSVFRPQGYEVSFAIMSAEEKNLISHRGIALRKMTDFLLSF